MKDTFLSMNFFEFMFVLFFVLIIISWFSVFITAIFQPNRFKKNNKKNELPEWEQGWPF